MERYDAMKMVLIALNIAPETIENGDDINIAKEDEWVGDEQVNETIEDKHVSENQDSFELVTSGIPFKDNEEDDEG
ncbi:hypothetical protein RJT34_29087 [Clitoria ternatea]|uniref:Uncharacterized protein n=1 Tax=Clitoria ternatea TaxID=43366 RepID=A0AAN9IHD0_CLITE